MVANLWNFIEQGGPLIWPLLFCFLVSLFIILERYSFWKNIDLNHSEELLQKYFELRNDASRDLIKEFLEAHRNNFFIRLCLFLSHDLFPDFSSDSDFTLKKVKQEHSFIGLFTQEAALMKRGLLLLDIIITIAPLLGLLGTVLGIIEAFENLDLGTAHDSGILTKGIYEALITTVLGILITIVTVIFYNHFFDLKEKGIALIKRVIAGQNALVEKENYFS